MLLCDHARVFVRALENVAQDSDGLRGVQSGVHHRFLTLMAELDRCEGWSLFMSMSGSERRIRYLGRDRYRPVLP
jgi:hypothetical protein